MTLGMLLILLGVVILVFPMVLVYLIASVFIAAGMFVIALARQFRRQDPPGGSRIVSWISRF